MNSNEIKRATITVRQGLFKTLETFTIEYKWEKEREAQIDQHLRKNYTALQIEWASRQREYSGNETIIL
jgi:hypothetical protein